MGAISLPMILLAPVVFSFALQAVNPEYAVWCVTAMMVALNLFGLLLALTVLLYSIRCVRNLLQKDGYFGILAETVYAVLGIPNDEDIQEIRTALWDRYKAKPASLVEATKLVSGVLKVGKNSRSGGVKAYGQGGRDALTYAERIVDRLINKARGLLPFNSILIGINTFQVSNFQKNPLTKGLLWSTAEFAILTGLSISSILLLELFYARWENIELYRYIEKEFNHTMIICRNRSVILNSAIVLSIYCLIGIIVTALSAVNIMPYSKTCEVWT